MTTEELIDTVDRLTPTQELIDTVDRLKPNAYSTEDKLNWISDVDSSIRATIMKYYGSATITTIPSTTIYSLPAGVNFEDIEYVFFNNKRVDKLDFRNIGLNGYAGNININSNRSVTITIYYLIRHPRYRYVEYVSEPNSITFGTNFIETTGAEFNKFFTGDTIKISGCTVNEGNNKQAVILSGVDTKMEFEDDTFTAGAETAAITIIRVLNDNLIVPEPYDKMYKEYLFAMIDFHNREYESYNNNMIMYNATLEAFTNWHKQRSPINVYSKITNIW
jgi:hypothetical protein